MASSGRLEGVSGPKNLERGSFCQRLFDELGQIGFSQMSGFIMSMTLR